MRKRRTRRTKTATRARKRFLLANTCFTCFYEDSASIANLRGNRFLLAFTCFACFYKYNASIDIDLSGREEQGQQRGRAKSFLLALLALLAPTSTMHPHSEGEQRASLCLNCTSKASKASKAGGTSEGEGCYAVACMLCLLLLVECIRIAYVSICQHTLHGCYACSYLSHTHIQYIPTFRY